MNRVLVIAYYFPSIGGAGSQRPAKFVRYLPENGYEPVVITGPGDSIGRWTPPDDSLSAEVGKTTEVLRVPGPEPGGATAWKERSERWLGRPSNWAKWWQDGVVELGRSVEGVDLVYAWMSPYESAEAAERLAAEIRRPWVADLGDPWALDEMMVYPSAAHRWRELQRMRRRLGSATAVIMSTPEAVTRVRQAFPELRPKPIVAIPNGFDLHDFERPAPPRDASAFRIVHTGYLHTELGRQQRRTAGLHRILGGGATGVDILTRSHIHLLEAVGRVLRDRAELKSRVRVELAGVLTQVDRDIALKSDVVHLHGYLPHAESLRLIRSADLLFLPMQNLPTGRRSSTVPGKTYEYLASGRPILGAVPEGDARDILEACGNAFLCRPDDVAEMARIITERIDANGSGDLRDPAVLRRFEYRELSTRLADIFDRVVGLQDSLADTRRSSRTEVAPVGLKRRQVLHLAYYFPPIGGAGAQRTLKFVRYLPLFGYDSTVVTGSGESGGRWTPADETLAEEVAAETSLVRVAGPEPSAASGFRGRAERWLGIAPRWSVWWADGAISSARTLRDVDVILASMSPYETAEAAARLAAELGKPWVAGLRDPWALDEMMVYPSGLHRRRELRRMRRLLASAAAIVVTTKEAVDQMRHAFPELRGKPIVSIPNGFDASDFEGEVPARTDGVFRIVHTGYLHTELGRKQRRAAYVHRLLGGETAGVDILTRSHVYLLDAVERLLSERPDLHDHIEVHLAGVLSDVDREIAARSPVVRLHGYLPHADSIALIRSADLLFLPMQNLPAGQRSTTVPGKTYEYLASRRPILGAVPDGDARDILEAAGNSRVCRPGDTAAIARAISAEIARVRAGEPPSEPAEDVLRQFERRHLTERLAHLLDSVITLGDERMPLSTNGVAPGASAQEREQLYAT